MFLSKLYIAALILFNTACSSRTKIFHQDQKLTEHSRPSYILKQHEHLEAKITVTFDVAYSINEENRSQERQAALVEALKTIYLFTYHAPTQESSDYRLTNCASYRLKNDHLVCSGASDARAWRSQDSKISLSEYYWQERFHTIYQEDLVDKPGLFWNPINHHEAYVELKNVQEKSDHSINIHFSFSRPLLHPRAGFPLYRLHLLDQRSPTIHLSSVNQYLALKMTGGEKAPIIGLSSELQRFIRRHVIRPTLEQGKEYAESIEKLMSQLDLDKISVCPIHTGLCKYRPFVNFQDASQVQTYLYNIELRDHLFGLLLLSHLTVSSTRLSDTKETFTFDIDMNKILTTYKTQLNRIYIQSPDFPL